MVLKRSITVNAGSLDHRVWLRINPGYGRGHSNKTNTGARSVSMGYGSATCRA
ncbi:MAG: Diaminopimelate decarboxylase (EC [uncultured Caballeronia sp.]|nr:MAG: Diaminopimelate decarboxylase (EC [uncultured Caballeronia sp.]